MQERLHTHSPAPFEHDACEAKYDSESESEFDFKKTRQEYFAAVDLASELLSGSREYQAYMVPETGFYVREQVYAFANAAAHIQAEIHSGRGSNEQIDKIKKIWKEDALKKTTQDIRSFYQEFVEYAPALPIPTAIRKWEGESRLFARYGNSMVLYEDIVDEAEREGAALSAIRNVETALTNNLDNNSNVVMISPTGWTGLADPPEHKNAQIYIFGQDESLTLRVSMDHGQSVDFLNNLSLDQSVSINGLSERERIKEIMNTSVVTKYNFEQIAKLASGVLPGNVMLTDDLGSRTLGDMLNSIENRRYSIVLGSRVEYLISKLEEYVNEIELSEFNPDLAADLAVKIGQIVLEIELADDPSYKDYLSGNPQAASASLPATDNYKLAAASLTQRTGCSHGVSKKKNKAETKILCCNCPFCGAFVEAVVQNGFIRCPSCGRSRKWGS